MKYIIIWALVVISPAHALDKTERTAYKLETADPMMTEESRITLCKDTISELRTDTLKKSDIEDKFSAEIKTLEGYINNQAFDDYNDLANLIKYENHIFMIKCME